MRVASKLAGSSEVPHASYRLEGEVAEDLPENSTRTASLVNGMVNFILSSNLESAYRAEAASAEVLLTGIGSDLYRAYWISAAGECPSEPEMMIPNAVRRWCQMVVPGLLKGVRDAEVLEALCEALARELGEVECSDLVLASEYLCMRERNTNFATCIVPLASGHMRTWDTFLYGPLVDSVVGLSLESRAETLIQRTLVQRSAALAATGTLRGRGAGLERLRPLARLSAQGYVVGNYYRKVVNKACRAAIRREPVGLNYMVDFTGALVANRGFVEDTLRHRDMVTGGLFDRKQLEEHTGLLLRGYGNLCYAMTNVMCLELWLRRISGITRLRMPSST